MTIDGNGYDLYDEIQAGLMLDGVTNDSPLCDAVCSIDDTLDKRRNEGFSLPRPRITRGKNGSIDVSVELPTVLSNMVVKMDVVV